MSEATNSEDLWNPYKELLQNVNKYLSGECENLCYSEFESLLRKHKQNFFSLLRNPPKNAKCREELKKGMESGIGVHGIGHQTLSKDLYQEAIILSDMYDLNEFAALDLLCTAQIQMPYYPGLPRGLVAVLLYYDGRKAILSTLRMLVQARRGVLWCLKIPEEIEKFVTLYTDQLMENGLFNRIFELLNTLDLSKEMALLQKNVALGGPRHQRQVIDLFNNIRLILADIVFLWSSQCGLPKQATLSLINHLRQQKIEEEASGILDNVCLYLLGSLLASVDLSILHTREDGEDVVQTLPILSENGFIDAIMNELLPGKNNWASEGLQGTALFAFSVCLSTLRLVPQSQHLQHAIEREDSFVDAAISMKVFKFLNHVVLENDIVFTEEVLHKRMHDLISDFIVYMYSKVKELRIKADETARTMQVYAHEGLEAPTNLPRHFEDFMYLIAKLYSKDPLNKQYMLEYWCPLDNTPQQTFTYRAPARAVSLFKFIRLAGDMVPSTLFVSYLNMLASLSGCQQAARYCFNMLKQSSGCNNTITWDHFFMSFNQYYSNLRQEMPPNDTVYRHRTSYHKGITPQEIDGLHAVLKLIRTIADFDDFSRLALCEHPGWAPLSVLLGLVSCSVPIPLKADILVTLSALSKSPETATQMWNNLEASQILVTIPSTSSYQPRGLQTELDEIESRMEEYPLTKSLLKLLDVLTDSGIPRTLGAGPRTPGFDPYLTFILNSIFLKFNSRSYKNSAEKWEVASLCLKLFEKFITQYSPEPGDFPSSNKSDKFNSPPGFHLMIQLNTKSEVLNLILYIINEGINLFDMYKPFSGQKYLEEATLSCLNIIKRDLMIQGKFFNLLSTGSSLAHLTNLNKLLLTINPRSGRPDHVLNIAKYTSHQITLPNHSYVSVKIVIYLTSSPLIHGNLMNILLSSMDSDKLIRNGFVECLDAGYDDDIDVVLLTKEAIITLLKQCLPYKAPNLTHFLLGFDVKKDIASTLFQLPGVMNFPRTCIHSLFSILKTMLCGTPRSKASLLEAAYHLLYLLCATHNTSEATLRLLRMQPNFFKDHITASYQKVNKGIHELNQLSWLLMTIAIELKGSCCTKKINYVKQLTQLLVGLPSQENIVVDPFSIVPTDRVLTVNENASVYNIIQNVRKNQNLLVQLITKFDFNIQEVVVPQWEFFDNTVLTTLLNNCQTDTTPKIINVKKLHQILIDELGAVQGTAAIGQRQAILQEIQKVLMHALNINNSRQTAASMIRFVDSWRQIIEVLVIYVPYEILPPDKQQILEIFILEQLLTKVVKVLLFPEIGNLLSGAVLLLLENLRKCHIYAEKQKKVLEKAGGIEPEPVNIIQSNILSLKVILNYLIEWIITSDVTAQKLRINLYGSLVTFLHLISVEQYNKNSELEDSLYVSRLDSSKLRIDKQSCTVKISSDVFSSFGEKLIEVLCHDCVGSQEVCKMLAMSCFSLLINLSGNMNWIAYMSGRGYLKHLIESILDMDNDLRLVLEPVPENMKPLYSYESKIALLSRIAMTRVGSELLLEQRILSCLSNMTVFNYHPEISKQWEDSEEIIDTLIPAVENRYLQIWLPSLHICNAILTSLGTDNKSAVVQIMHYLLSHIDVLEIILRAGNPSLSALALKELSVLSSIIGRTANNDLVNLLENLSVPQDNRTHLYRIQKLMLSLLAKFILSDGVVRDLLSDPRKGTTYQTTDRLLYTLQIISNLLLYTRNLIANHGIDHSCIGVIFQPTLSDPGNNFNGKQYKNFNEHSPSLGVIVQHLISSVTYFHKEKLTLNFLQGKLNDISILNTADLKDLVCGTDELFELSVMRETAYEMLSEKLQKKRQEIDHCNFIIENSLYLIWAHLDYYMLKAISKSKNHGLLNTSTSFQLDSLVITSEATWKISTDDISNLKQGLVSIFSDSFSSQLLETTQGRSDSDRGMIEVMLRKIKRLIQFVPVK